MINSFYPVILCNNLEKTADFFVKHFDFEAVFSSEWYISMQRKDGFEIAFIDKSHDTIPKQYKRSCEGLILNFEVDNVNEFYSKLTNNNEITIISDIKDENFGQRHFIIEGPENLLIDIIEIIPFSDEFSDNYEKK